MGMQWTEEQKKVIELRERNILVSAAAGSGKTAVLVERILTMLMDPVRPVDIDKLLIMTFTRAAAGEMKSRLSQALEDALEQEPDNEQLQRQTALVHNAQITTIDGFCAYVIRNYFHLIGLDPGYRTGEEGELKLLKTDVVKALLEDKHQEGASGFLALADAYAPGKTDGNLEEMVLKLYEFSTSAPWPREWLKNSARAYEAKTGEALGKEPWMELLWQDTGKQLSDLEGLARENLELCLGVDGPYPYEEAVRSDLFFVEKLQEKCREKDFDGMTALFLEHSWTALSRKKGDGVSEMKKELVKQNRDTLKKSAGKLQENYFYGTLEEMLEPVKRCREPMQELVKLVLEFSERFAQAKRQKNLLDFSDMEHFALDILVKREEDGTLIPSLAARELSEKYEEILIDEYQDSNQVQETIMNLVAGWAKGRKNVFLVGDVKQSIYRFRLAKPELFMEKFHRFTLEDSEEQRIDLSRNFRSRPQVLDSVNYLFRQMMGEELGKVEYDDAAALYPGANYPSGGREEFPVTEVLLIEKDAPELEDEKSARAAKEAEALAIANRIREMVGRELVYDKKLGTYRTVQYGDIVILLRTVTGWAEEFAQVLTGQGIPAYTASKTGYFSALEVVTVLNYLRICDNPRQDIPMAAVLHSPMVGCTAQELARLKLYAPELPIYEQVQAYLQGQGEGEASSQEEQALYGKLSAFWKELGELRERVPYTPIHQLILYLLEKTGYQDYVCALPAGEQRKANLNMLVEKAMEYEKTSYRGLFNFIRYMEQLQKYSVDFGEVNLAAGEQTVQIMSIHKSKGLEFPIVFAAGMGKKFNLQDVNSGLLIHPDYGIGCDGVDPVRRIRCTTLVKKVMRQQLLEESLGEELRVLYVALTRAKEKLLITGTIGKLENQIRNLQGFLKRTKEKLPFTTLSEARDGWGWILPALSRHCSMEELYREYDCAGNPGQPFYGREGQFLVHHVRPMGLIEEEVERQGERQMRKTLLENWDQEKIYEEAVRQELQRRFAFRYPYEALGEIPVKLSVSDLKKRSYREEDSAQLYQEQEILPLLPRFACEQEETYAGAAKGTAYHRVLECLDYLRTDSLEQVREQLQEMLTRGKLREQELSCVEPQVLWKFVQSSLGQRMKKASAKGVLKREQPFVLSRPASQIQDEWKTPQSVLIQGIIDAYFWEEDALVLVDYKTDQVQPGEERRLARRYQVQLQSYGEALERMTGKQVKEKILYSITLQKEIHI